MPTWGSVDQCGAVEDFWQDTTCGDRSLLSGVDYAFFRRPGLGQVGLAGESFHEILTIFIWKRKPGFKISF